MILKWIFRNLFSSCPKQHAPSRIFIENLEARLVMNGDPVALEFEDPVIPIVIAGEVIPEERVKVVDLNGATVTAANPAVVLSNIFLVGNQESSVFNETPVIVTSNGIITLNNLVLNRAGNYILRVRAPDQGLSDAFSNVFGILPAGVETISLSTLPNEVVAGSSPGNLTVTLFDGFGNLATNATLPVTLDISGQDSISALPVNGVATFTLPELRVAGTKTITARLENADAIGQLSINVVPGQPVGISFTQSVVFATPKSIIPSIQARIVDSLGNTVTSGNGSVVTLNLATTSASRGQLSGTLNALSVDGVVTFSGLSVDLVGSYSITASIANSSLISLAPLALNIESPKAEAISGLSVPSIVIPGISTVITGTVQQFGRPLRDSRTPIQLIFTGIPQMPGGRVPRVITTARPDPSGNVSFSPRFRVATTYAATAKQGRTPLALTGDSNLTVAPGEARSSMLSPVPSVSANTSFPASIKIFDSFRNPINFGSVTFSLVSVPDEEVVSTVTVPVVAGGASTTDLIALIRGQYRLRASFSGSSGDPKLDKNRLLTVK